MSSRNPPFFFASTQSVNARLGDSHSFISAGYAGLRELWWQVRGFRGQFPQFSVGAIESKFLSGLPAPGGIDFERMFLNSDWERHEQEFAKWFVFDACTLYENWAERVCSDLFPAKVSANLSKQIQFPSAVDKKGRTTGYTVAVTEANRHSSALIKAEFFPILAKHPLNRWASIEDHLVAFRYFKECRNAIIHSDELVTQSIVDWRTKLHAAQAKTTKPFRHEFAIPPQNVGDKIKLVVRDAILFATIVRFLICTFDAALCVAKASEVMLEARLRSVKTKNGAFKNLPGDPLKREKRIGRFLAAARIPKPVSVANVDAWMYTKGIIR